MFGALRGCGYGYFGVCLMVFGSVSSEVSGLVRVFTGGSGW